MRAWSFRLRAGLLLPAWALVADHLTAFLHRLPVFEVFHLGQAFFRRLLAQGSAQVLSAVAFYQVLSLLAARYDHWGPPFRPSLRDLPRRIRRLPPRPPGFPDL